MSTYNKTFTERCGILYQLFIQSWLREKLVQEALELLPQS